MEGSSSTTAMGVMEGFNSGVSLSYLKDKQLFNTTRMELKILSLFNPFLDLFPTRTLTCPGSAYLLEEQSRPQHKVPLPRWKGSEVGEVGSGVI